MPGDALLGAALCLLLYRRFPAADEGQLSRLKAAGAEVTWLPVITAPMQDTKALEETTRLIDILEEHEDVKEVYSNAEFPE